MFGRKKQPNLKKPKVCDIFNVKNKDMKFTYDNGNPILKGNHDVIVTNVNRIKGTCKVQTITSLTKPMINDEILLQNKKIKSQQINGAPKIVVKGQDVNHRFKEGMIEKLSNGKIILIPNSDLNSTRLCGVSKDARTIKINQLSPAKYGKKFPNMYKKIILK